jgi:transcriptional regulator with XRE-family HTH domain
MMPKGALLTRNEVVMSEDVKQIVRKLKEIRETIGWSQRQVGQAMGVTTKTPEGRVSGWERGDRTPTDENLAAWAAALGMELRITRTLAPATKREE